uniref:Uncharacterized protein n=1 Tax=Trichogramma kaykai TaxID=54128 RepID=A0ABD2VYC0_9HYME
MHNDVRRCILYPHALNVFSIVYEDEHKNENTTRRCYTRAGRSLSDAGFRPSAIFIQARVFCIDSTPRQLERVVTQQNEAPNSMY